jgi:hypothetical protein
MVLGNPDEAIRVKFDRCEAMISPFEAELKKVKVITEGAQKDPL